MAELNLSPEAIAAYVLLEKAHATDLLDAIDDALDLLEANPGDASARRISYTGSKWGIPVRDRTDDWVIIWEQDEQGVVQVPYIGHDPFA